MCLSILFLYNIIDLPYTVLYYAFMRISIYYKKNLKISPETIN